MVFSYRHATVYHILIARDPELLEDDRFADLGL